MACTPVHMQVLTHSGLQVELLVHTSHQSLAAQGSTGLHQHLPSQLCSLQNSACATSQLALLHQPSAATSLWLGTALQVIHICPQQHQDQQHQGQQAECGKATSTPYRVSSHGAGTCRAKQTRAAPLHS